MELRSFVRRSITMNVALWVDDSNLVQGDALNVSRDGIFMEIDPNKLENQIDFKIRFEAQQNGVNGHYEIPAKLVHLSRQGAGFSFLISNQFDFQFAHHLLGQKILTESRAPFVSALNSI